MPSKRGLFERAINRVGDTAEVMVGRAEDKVVLVTRRLAVRVARSPAGRRGGVSFRLSLGYEWGASANEWRVSVNETS